MLVHVGSRGRSTASKHTSARTVAHDGGETHGLSDKGERERERQRGGKGEKEKEGTREPGEDGTKVNTWYTAEIYETTLKARKSEKRRALEALLKRSRIDHFSFFPLTHFLSYN